MSYIYKRLVYICTIVLLINSCSNSGDPEQGAAMLEKQKLILSQLDKIGKDVSILKKKVSSNAETQRAILNKIGNSSKQNTKPKQQAKAPDANRVYNVDIGESFVKGNKDAKVTIIEWMDFQ